VTALDILLVAAVLVGMSVQAAIGFGFAFFVAPAAFAAFSPEQAVMLVLLLAIAINCLVLFGERRRTEVAVRQTATVVCAAIPGMLAGAWIVTEVDHDVLQVLVGLIVLAGALVQSLAARSDGPAPGPVAGGDRPLTEIGGGLASGVLTTSVSVNGPALVLTFSRLGLRGGPLRDSLAGALLGLSLPATLIVGLFAGREGALPQGWVLAACVPAVLVGHRFGASVFRHLDDGSHHRAALGAAAIAGLLSIGAAVL
jgi:uncharacterized membrane protein YfcA